MTVMVKILFKVYERGKRDAAGQPTEYPVEILDRAGEIALDRVGASLVRSRMNDRKFVCVLDRGLDHHAKVTIYAEVLASGVKWMQSLGALKASGVKATAIATETLEEIADQVAVMEHPPEDLAATRARLIAEGEVLCVSPDDSDLFLISSEILENIRRVASGRRYVPEDDGHLLTKTVRIR